MKVLLVNGSPHANGCTQAALRAVAEPLQKAGIETVFYHIGAAPVGGCVGCNGCARAGHCVFGGPPAEVRTSARRRCRCGCGAGPAPSRCSRS